MTWCPEAADPAASGPVRQTLQMQDIKRPQRRWFVRPSSAYDQRSAMLFLAPMMLVLSVVAVFPVLYSFWISLHDLKLTRPHRVPFVWFDNYVKLFTDPLFWESVGRTASFTVMSVLAIMVIATLMSLLLNENFRGRRVLSAILLTLTMHLAHPLAMMGPVFLSSIGFAMILGASAGMALAPFGHCAGTAAALLGLFQMSGSGALVGITGWLMPDPLSQLALHMWLLLPPLLMLMTRQGRRLCLQP